MTHNSKFTTFLSSAFGSWQRKQARTRSFPEVSTPFPGCVFSASYMQWYLLEMRDNLAPILNIFPVLFFLCAVLMMVSTMNRLIENARSDIGTFKALGYSDAKIMCYYLLHAGFILYFQRISEVSRS